MKKSNITYFSTKLLYFLLFFFLGWQSSFGSSDIRIINDSNFQSDLIIYGGTSAAITAAVLALDHQIALQDLDYDELKEQLLKDGQVLSNLE